MKSQKAKKERRKTRMGSSYTRLLDWGHIPEDYGEFMQINYPAAPKEWGKLHFRVFGYGEGGFL